MILETETWALGLFIITDKATYQWTELGYLCIYTDPCIVLHLFSESLCLCIHIDQYIYIHTMSLPNTIGFNLTFTLSLFVTFSFDTEKPGFQYLWNCQ